jgi:hypothetical protein
MSKSDECYCPNQFCRIEKLAVGEKACPECGAYVRKIEGKELAKLLQQKRALPPQEENEQAPTVASEQDEKVLFTEMTDDQIRTLISQEMSNLARLEAGTALMSPDALVSLKGTDQMIGSGIKTLLHQNKIMIRQNELIIRGLKKLAGKMDESRH